MKATNKELLDFIALSPSVFHAADNIKTYLVKNGFEYIKEGETAKLKAGKYVCTRNGSSVAAFEIPEKIKDYHFQIVSSHSDSPTYKLKYNYELSGPDNYVRLDVESYGGMIDYTWLDRPLSVAGRVFIKNGLSIESRLVYIDKDILLIPSLAVHQNRDVNKGFEFNRAVDLCPLFSAGTLKTGDFCGMLAEEIGVDKKDIVSWDLFLVNRCSGCIWGYKDEFISSPKLDDLQAAFTSLKGFISSDNPGYIKLYVCFDNEEVGSNTKQGAESTFLKDVLKRINYSLGKSDDELRAAVSKSFMVSFDNAHALHPNHPEKCDSINSCYMNKGIVIKENAAQHYTTDAFSRAVFKEICKKAEVPTQVFANRSDLAGGSTLGNISNVQVSMHCVDIGIAQLAMHSSYETAGSRDSEFAIKAINAYYSSLILIDGAEKIEIK